MQVCDMKLPNLRRPLYGVGEHSTIFFFLNQILLDSTPDNFTKILQIEWNWVRSLKFETVRIQFLSDVFGFLSSRNFATMVTWRNDFSSIDFPKKKSS